MKKNAMRVLTLLLLVLTLLSFTACGGAFNVGVLEDSKGESYFSGMSSQYAGLALFPHEGDMRLAYEEMENGVLDFIVLDRTKADEALEAGDFKLIDIPIVGDFYGFAVGPTNSRLLNSINKAIAAKAADIAAAFDAPSDTAVAVGTPDPANDAQLVVTVALDTAYAVTVLENGMLTGAEIDVARLVAEHMGRELVILTAPTASEAVASLRTGGTDAVIGGLADNGSYTGRANFSNPYCEGDYQVIVCPESCTLFDNCKANDELLMVLRTLKKQSDLEASIEIFTTAFIKQGGYMACLRGLLYTVIIAVCGLLIGIVIGTLIATVKVMPKYKRIWRILEKIVDGYVGFFRGTPIIVQLLIGYFVLLPALGVSIERLWVAVIVYGMNSGAYVSEIMRSGIQSVDPGQLEASRALGLGFPISMLKIVIPQAIKNILPTLGNEFITLIKDTSVVSFIAIVDVTKAFRQIGDSTYEYVIPYVMLALVYLVIVGLISTGVKFMEKGLKKNER